MIITHDAKTVNYNLTFDYLQPRKWYVNERGYLCYCVLLNDHYNSPKVLIYTEKNLAVFDQSATGNTRFVEAEVNTIEIKV